MKKKIGVHVNRRLVEIILVGVLYYAGARLSFWMAQPPSNISSFWPPSGIALAGCLIFGWPVTIGIFAAAFAANLGELQGAAALPVVAAIAAGCSIAAGSTLQAWLSAWLIRRVIKTLPPVTIRATLQTIGITALVTLLAPIIAAISLCLAGLVPWASLPALLMTFWLNDFIGVLIFVPAPLILWMHWRKVTIREPFLWPLTCFILGLTLFTFQAYRATEKQHYANDVRSSAQEMTQVLLKAIDQNVQTLTAMRAFYLASEIVTRAEFFGFTTPLLGDSSVTSALAWVPRVSQTERQGFEQLIRQYEKTDYVINEKDAYGLIKPAAIRDEYYPITFIEPLTNNLSTLGFDIGSDPVRRAALVSARDSGRVAATAPIQLVQQNGSQTGILMIMPVYEKGMPTDTQAARRDNWRGMVIDIFRLNLMVEKALTGIHRYDIELYLYDIARPDDAQFLAFYPSISGAQSLPVGGAPNLETLRPQMVYSALINVGGRDWLALARPGPAYAQTSNQGWVAWLALILGLAMASGFLVFVNTRKVAEANLARSETEFRTLSDGALTGILRMKLSGEMLYANEALASMFGLETPDHMLRVKISAYLSKPAQYETFTQTLLAGGQVRNQVIDIITGQGQNRHLLFSAVLIKDVVSATIVDISERIRSEKEIRQLSRVVSQMADIVIISDVEGVIEYVNPAFEQVTGYSRAEAIGSTPRLLKSRHHPLEYYQRLWDTILSGKVFQDEIVNRKKNGDLYYESKTITPIRDSRGQITHFVATGKDISERKQMEAALRQREEEYRLISEHTGDVIWILDVETERFLYVSPSIEKLRGLTQAESMQQSFSELLTPESLKKVRATLPERLAVFKKDPSAVTYTDLIDQYRRDGSVVNTEMTTTLVINPAGKLQVVGITRDISERKQAEQLQETVYQIAEAAHTAESLVDLYPRIHANIRNVMDAENFYIALFDETSGLLRIVYSVDEKDPWDQTPFVPGTGLTEYVLRTGQSLLCDGVKEEGLVTQGHTTRVGELSKIWLGVPLIVHGRTIGMMAVQHYTDEGAFKEREQHILEFVSSQVATAIDRKLASEMLLQSQASLETAQSIAHLGNWELDLAHSRYYWSKEMYDLYRRDPAAGVPGLAEFLKLIHPDDRRPLLEAQQRSTNTHSLVSIEYRSNPALYEIRYLKATIQAKTGADGSLLRLYGTVLDITEIKITQRALEALNRDLEQRVEERTAEVRQSEATYRALFENSNDGIFLISPEGVELNANQRALDMIGYSLKEYLTQNHFVIDITPADQRADAAARLKAVLRGERVPLYERTLIAKDGAPVYVEINLSAVRNPAGKAILVQSVVRDISERKKAEEALRDSRDKLSIANAALEKASRLKDEFLSSMSHELRTPLTGILGLAEALQLQTYGPLTDKHLKALKHIESSGRHLLELINDILDLSKIEAGKLEMMLDPCSAADICQASLQLVKGMAHQKKQNIRFSINPVTIYLRADSRRLKQMLVNLLSNAVKFTPDGGSLGLEVEACDAEEVVRFCVWDKGIGIAPENMSKLFKPFVQLDSSLTRQYSGTGLGLSLVQRMTDLHGGSVHVESTPGLGSRFTICLPFKPLGTRPLTDIKIGTGALKNTLVIEDNRLDAEHAARQLAQMGIETVIQPQISSAFDTALRLRPSVILLDLLMGDSNGLELLVQLKADERTRSIPVIITSVEDRQNKALRLGASGYLVKPYSQLDFRAELLKAAALVVSNNPVLVIASAPVAPLVMIVDDNDLILETFSDFLQVKGYRVTTAHSGFELLDCAPQQHPDIILIDIEMPGMDGIDTIRRIRAHKDPLLAATPMIAVTALAMAGDRERCLQAGANEYLSKPVVLSNLVRQIDWLIEEQTRA